MAVNPSAGQPGNSLPIIPGTTTDTFEVSYGLTAQFRRGVQAISANTYSVGASQSGTVFTYGGLSSGVVITLPTPQAGLWYEFCATGVISTAGTTINCGTTGAFIVPGDSGGADAVVASATTVEFAVAGPGVWMSFVGLSSAKYIARGTKQGSSAASTGHWAASS